MPRIRPTASDRLSRTSAPRHNVTAHHPEFQAHPSTPPTTVCACSGPPRSRARRHGCARPRVQGVLRRHEHRVVAETSALPKTDRAKSSAARQPSALPPGCPCHGICLAASTAEPFPCTWMNAPTHLRRLQTSLTTHHTLVRRAGGAPGEIFTTRPAAREGGGSRAIPRPGQQMRCRRPALRIPDRSRSAPPRRSNMVRLASGVHSLLVSPNDAHPQRTFDRPPIRAESAQADREHATRDFDVPGASWLDSAGT